MTPEKKDFAFQFIPGEYLRDTQCLSEKAQVAYDRIMCDHIRNVANHMESICIPYDQVSFFTRRLNADEKAELMYVLKEIPGPAGGYQISWVADKIAERQRFIESRTVNGSKKKKKAYAKLPNSDSNNDSVIDNKNGSKIKKQSSAKMAFDLIPDTFHGDEFAVLWDDYEQLRKAKKKPLTETAVKQRVNQLIKISGGNWKVAKVSMENTIAGAWDEFFEPKSERLAIPSGGRYDHERGPVGGHKNDPL